MILYGIMYTIFVLLTLAISYVIRPCIYAVLSAFNFIDSDTLMKILQYYRKQLMCMKQLVKYVRCDHRLHKQGNKWNNKSSEESISMSRTPPMTIDSRGVNATKKIKRINVESGDKRRSFKLSLLFLMLQLVSAILSYFIVIKDMVTYGYADSYIEDVRTIHHYITVFQLDEYILSVGGSDREHRPIKRQGRLQASGVQEYARFALGVHKPSVPPILR